MLDLITIFVTFAVVLWINTRISRRIEQEVGKTNKSSVANVSTHAGENLQVRDIDELRVERYRECYYFFQEKTDQFIGQGLNLEMAAKHFTSLRGVDILGCFVLDDKRYCFINNECMPFELVKP